MLPREEYIRLDEIRLHIKVWQPAVPRPGACTFLLLHGLSSNANTWDMVAGKLADAGFPTIAADQRGHGLSDKPDHGYDFATITKDLYQLVQRLNLQNVILAGQSWGGNVGLEAAARYPDIAQALVFVDGGFLDLSSRGSWEEISVELRPPKLAGLPRAAIEERIGAAYPGWIPNGVKLTLGNFEILEDGTVRPWLALKNHMDILRALYEQDVAALFPEIKAPVLICPVDDGSERDERKRAQVRSASENIPDARVVWFKDTAHDIHVDQPEKLAGAMLDFAESL